MFRQGDVLIIPVSNNEAKVIRDSRTCHVQERDEQDRVVLAYGEVTGHAHAIHESRVRMFHDGALARSLLKVDEHEKIVHEEHGTVDLKPGFYEVRRQREFDAEAERQERFVAD